MSKTKQSNLFKLQHRVEVEETSTVKIRKHMLSFIPNVECEGYPPKEIEISENQWNALRFHFARKVDDLKKISELAYLY